MFQRGKKNEQKPEGSTNRKKFRMPQTSFARAFQNVATDIHGFFKKTLFTILRGTKGKTPRIFFFSGFAVGGA